MKRFLQQHVRESLGLGVEERLDEVSADLPYELQSKMFDQLAAVGIAGAGLTVTLIGSLFHSASPVAWLPVIFFGAAALFAVSGNIYLIDGLFWKRATIRRSKAYSGMAVALIGLAIGSLSMTVYFEGKADRGEAKGRSAPPKDEGGTK